MFPAMIVLITAVVVFWVSIMLDAVLLDHEFSETESFWVYAVMPWDTLKRLWNLLSA